MRRLIAYLTLTFTLIFGAALNSVAPMRNLISNNEYQSGREFVYRISDKENPDNTFEVNDMTAVDQVAAVMEKRMQNFGVSEFNIAKEGNNIIRATTSLQSETEYNRLQVYLNYNANFTVTIGDDDNTEARLDADEVFDGVNARVEYRGPYPFIIFPLSNPELFETNIVKAAQEIQDEKGSTDVPEGAERPELVKEATIVLWSDYDPDKDSYLNPTGDTQGKIFLTFDHRSMYWDEDKTEIGVASPVQGASETTSPSTAQIKEASETARYMKNVFNAGTLDYKVEFLFANKYTAPTVEPLIALGNRDNLALSATLFASIIAILLVLIVAFAIYRLPIISGLSSAVLTFLGTLLIFNAIQVEFSTSAILGFLIVTLASLISTIAYAAKFRGEVYKGRSFKKAHGEAINKSNLIALDMMVVMLVTGVFSYFFGGAALAGFATTLIFGSIVMMISVLLHNSLTLPLLANNKLSSSSYSMYGITESKVPNLLNDEKPTYFGRFVNHESGKNAKIHTGITGGLSGVAAVLILVFAASTTINPFNLVKHDENTTRVYFQVSEKSPITTISAQSPTTLLSYISLDGGETTFADLLVKEKGVVVNETHTFTKLEEEGEDEISVVYNFYVYDLKGAFDGKTQVYYKTSDTDAFSSSAVDLDEAMGNIVGYTGDDKANVSFNNIKKEAITPHYGRIAWVSLVTLALTSIYIGLRFGLTRGITNFIQSFIAASFVFIFFMATRIAIPPVATIGAFVAILFVSFLNSIIFINIRDVEKDNTHKDLTRVEKYSLGLRHTLSLVYIATLLSGISFFVFTLVGPLGVSSVYLGALIAIVGALYLVTKSGTLLLSSMVNLFGRLPERKKKVKKTNVQRTSIKSKSGEPEEAIFIGIND